MKKVFFVLLLINTIQANELQEAINLAKEGDYIELSPGVYEGNIIINKALTIDGINNKAIIKGENNSTVIKIISSNVVLKNLTITDSGSLHTNIDSAISCNDVKNITIKNNIIKNSLFGIDFAQTHNSKIINNQISSKPLTLGLRGDGIRLWYSHNNLVESNKITKSRDMVLWYSSKNIIRKNYANDCRYSLHFMYAGENLVEQNIYENNSVGIFFMFSSGTIAKDNIVKNSKGAFGVGIGMKDASDFKVYNNTFMYNARGIYSDQSPFQPNTTNIYKNNKILFNTIGINFHANLHKNIFEENVFKANIQSVSNDTPGSKLEINKWRRNYFDEYEGMDRDKDGIGDIEYRAYLYADRLLNHKPNLQFFYGSSIIGILNFLSKLAPFSEPELLLTDKEPRMSFNDE